MKLQILSQKDKEEYFEMMLEGEHYETKEEIREKHYPVCIAITSIQIQPIFILYISTVKEMIETETYDFSSGYGWDKGGLTEQQVNFLKKELKKVEDYLKVRPIDRKGCEKIGEVENKEILVCEKKDFDSSGREVIFIERVSYGKPNTPIELREYKIVGKPDSKVGTIKEWEDWSLKNYKVVVIQTIGKKILE